MLRKAGLLNLSQVLELVYDEFADEIWAIHEQGGNPSGPERARVWAAWQWRIIIDDCREVYLLDHTGEVVCIDSLSVFHPRKGKQDREKDIELREPLTQQELHEFEQALNFSWEYVDPLLGHFSVPKVWTWRSVTSGKEARIRNHLLRRFNGRTITISETSARKSITWIKETLAATKLDQADTTNLSVVFETFRQAFPKGKGNATWQDVESRTGYSRRHLTRAIKYFETE